MSTHVYALFQPSQGKEVASLKAKMNELPKGSNSLPKNLWLLQLGQRLVATYGLVTLHLQPAPDMVMDTQ